MPGTGNISANPLFVNRPPRAYFLLSQIAAGQGQNSPCVDAGDPASPMVSGTTRTDGVPDAGIVDMGYHWTLPSVLPEYVLIGGGSTPALQNSAEYSVYASPNPFNPSTVISYQLSVGSFVNLAVYDVLGRKVVELISGWRNAGLHEVTFDGSGLASGVYIYRLTTTSGISSCPDHLRATGKMVLVK
jgi:hypothetical protein